LNADLVLFEVKILLSDNNDAPVDLFLQFYNRIPLILLENPLDFGVHEQIGFAAVP